MDDNTGKEESNSKRTRIAETEDDKKESSSPHAEKQDADALKEKKEETKTSSPTPAAAVPSWLSSQPAPTWESSATTQQAVPSWLQAGASSSSTTTTTASSVPSWLSANSSSASVFGSSGATGASFGSLSNSASVFGAPPPAAAASKEEAGEERSEDEDGKSDGGESKEESKNAAFGAKVGTDKDDEEQPPASKETGEENERVFFHLRAKLFKLVKDASSGSWVELGSGPLRINVPNTVAEGQESAEATGFARLIMRRQGVWTLLLNAPIITGMTAECLGDKMLRLACESFTGADGSGQVSTFLIKCAREDQRDELAEKIQLVLPRAATGLVESTSAAAASAASEPVAKDE